MFLSEKTAIRHTAEAELVRRALDGDYEAVQHVVQDLGSADSDTRQVMLETLHDLNQENLCLHVLRCLAFQEWNHHRDCDLRTDLEASERIDESIIQFFTRDERETETSIKESVLHKALEDPEPQARHAAACLIGMRGDLQAIPVLEEAIISGKMIWKLRAIRALDLLNDERCGPPLIMALSMYRNVLHGEALQALKRLGPVAEPAWLEALDHPDSHIRWHAARGLGELGDPRAANILAEGLLDPISSVTWASAEVLGTLSAAAVPAILEVLSRPNFPRSARQASIHALHRAAPHESQERLKPLLDALRDPSGSTRVPPIAQRLLVEWKGA